ncbi:DMT family transporter [Francisella frigiditurris]|uniref:Guanidinium exporter n=1 Tax=Francisella frigiditurris TaxID=1542390 RepID=A0A1J0KUE5_9GAMM|nr:multidrug efflux SMR transporter [Francisella frigiditurris]APC97270.1 quaternary ammonium compound-resistance protein sugE [Francisella frigiditurris]
MAWFFLIIAGVFEVVWAVALKYSNGFTNIIASIIVVIGMIASIYLLALSMRTIPISLAYPIWTAVGALGTAIFGMMFAGDTISTLKIVCLFLIIAGVIGLKISS